VRTRHFVFALSASDAPDPRLGITASRRVGNAVARNRIKRVVREAFRATRDIWPPGCDAVVIVRWAEPGLRLDTVVAEWRAAAGQIAKRAADAKADAKAEADARRKADADADANADTDAKMDSPSPGGKTGDDSVERGSAT
jgi:ribonuclease P protein component